MEILNVLAAAAASWVFGAVWYMALAKPWMAAAKITVDENGRPANDSAMPYLLSAVAMILVAGMMRHVFALGLIDSPAKGIVAGAGIGLFFISPWIAINNLYGMRPLRLTLIDGGYATLGCAAMGLVLTLL